MDEQNMKTVLIVDDEGPLLRGLSDKFEYSGMRVLTASNGEDGLRIALLEHPDITLLDLVMPKMDGIQFLENIRKDSWGKDALVVIWSNSRTNETETSAHDLGVVEYWTKSDYTFTQTVEKAVALIKK